MLIGNIRLSVFKQNIQTSSPFSCFF